ncbi:MAG TPA: MarR family transcriptional regulator [Microvirga sp.]|jgi:DNA-binding MarR family transcriptional regulator|nr:MarR family transcriptional regulator [Microvirga sp.]
MSTRLTYTDGTVSDVTPVALKSRAADEDVLAEVPAYDLIELFFFAYRDFVSDPDRILADYGFGRAHHRVLHFVDRQAGLTIAELLDILRITKQSLNRVLKELIEKGFIESRTGTSDRRQRLLHTTPQGHELALKLAKLQTRRIMRALSGVEPEAKALASRYLLAMIDADDRAHVERIVFGEVDK